MDSVLARISLGLRIGWDRRRLPGFALLQVDPLAPGAVDAHHLVAALRQAVPADGSPALLVRSSDRALLHDLLGLQAIQGVGVVLPAFDGLSSQLMPALDGALARGVRVVWEAPLEAPLPWRERPSSLWRLARPEPAQWLRMMAGLAPDLHNTLLEGVADARLADRCLDREGAAAMVGWPAEDACAHPPHAGPWPPDRTVLRRVLVALGQDAPLDRVEESLAGDPVLVWRFLRYVNSAALGLEREVGSLRHALMLLGNDKLREWVHEEWGAALDRADLQPVRWHAVLRARLMRLQVDAGTEHELQSELYLCGLLLELDLLVRDALPAVLNQVPLPERVLDAVLRDRGPYAPFLQMVRAMEDPAQGTAAMVARDPDLDLMESNRALLRMLAGARLPLPGVRPLVTSGR